MRRLVVNITTSEDRAQQTHRTVLTNPEWPNMFGTGLERLWSRLSFWLRHHAALREGLHSDRTIIRTLCSACPERDGGGTATGRRPLGHSSAHPSFRSLDSKDASMHGLWPSGPKPPTPTHRRRQSIFASFPSSTWKPIANSMIKGPQGINPRRTSGHKTARKRYHHPALCIWAWPGRCHVRLARPWPTATPHTASH